MWQHGVVASTVVSVNEVAIPLLGWVTVYW